MKIQLVKCKLGSKLDTQSHLLLLIQNMLNTIYKLLK